MEAKTGVTWRLEGTVVGRDGYCAEFVCDDSLRSWLSIARWNLHYRHWGALRGNVRDLFTTYLWRSLWRRS